MQMITARGVQFCLESRTSCCPDSQTSLGCMPPPGCALHRPSSTLLQAHCARAVWCGGGVGAVELGRLDVGCGMVTACQCRD